jgi:methyl-accepting chemotaxis protein
MLQFSLELDKTREQMESLGKKVTEISSTFSETVGEGLRDYQEVSNETDKILSRIRTDLQRISQSYSRTVEEAARSMTKADSQLQTAVIQVNRNSLDNFTRQLEAMVDRLDKMAPRRTTDAVIPAQNAE